MKKILLVAFTILSLNCYSQTPSIDTLLIVDTTALDTIPVLIPVVDTSHYYDVYRSTGTLLKHNADSYYAVPSGGWRIKLGLINNSRVYLEGYEVWKTRLDLGMELVETLNLLKERIGAPYTRVGIGIPILGINF